MERRALLAKLLAGDCRGFDDKNWNRLFQLFLRELGREIDAEIQCCEEPVFDDGFSIDVLIDRGAEALECSWRGIYSCGICDQGRPWVCCTLFPYVLRRPVVASSGDHVLLETSHTDDNDVRWRRRWHFQAPGEFPRFLTWEEK